MCVKINRFEIRNNGLKYRKIYDYLNSEDIIFLSTENEEINKILAEVVLNALNEEYSE